MRFGVVVFPGSNCDQDVVRVVRDLLGCEARAVWHGSRDLGGLDAVVLPGGFSYGDYLRSGALAARSPVMGEVARFAARGGPVIGICNGFQVLLEAGLLPGALLRNRGLRFVCEDVRVVVDGRASDFTKALKKGSVLTLPIAHAEGNYAASEEALDRLEGEGRVVLRYCGPGGALADEWNPNGSARHVAGIASERGNVVGLMPHPERACEPILGGVDGRALFESVLR
jgi:phosphoribosylformylglycinamidine synthase